MSPQDRIRLKKALHMARMALQAFEGINLVDLVRNDCIHPTDAHRSLSDAVLFLRCALGRRYMARDEEGEDDAW